MPSRTSRRQRRVVGSGRGIHRRRIGWHRVHALVRNGHSREQRLACHPVVAALIVRGHEALVAENDVGPRPVDRVAMSRRQQLVRSPRRVAARERQREPSARRNALTSDRHDLVGRGIAQRLEVAEWSNVAGARHLVPEQLVATRPSCSSTTSGRSASSTRPIPSAPTTRRRRTTPPACCRESG